MVMTKNENNQKCPENIIKAAQTAQNILRRALQQLEQGKDTSEYWDQFVNKNKAQMLQAMKNMQTQLQTISEHGEVKPKRPEREEDSRGYRYEIQPDNGIYAYTKGEGDEALITITSNAKDFSERGLAWQWLHEVSHATPSLKTMDYGYVNERIFPYLKSLGKSNNADSIVAAIFSIEGLDQPREKRFQDEKDIYKPLRDLSEEVQERVKKIMAIAEKGVAQLVSHELDNMQEIVDLKEKALAQDRTYPLQGEEKDHFERMAKILTNKPAPTLSEIKKAITTAREGYQALHLLCFGEPQRFCEASGEEEDSWLKVEGLINKHYIWGVHESVLTGTEETRATELLTTMIEQDKVQIQGWEATTMAKLAIKCYGKW
ncbi:MAG TPA: hypothetical protein VFB60_17150 [Ktedonobacteraceae bacterium]|nr:hypothetical protein [Ktedonobacteraceae bacterium]